MPPRAENGSRRSRERMRAGQAHRTPPMTNWTQAPGSGRIALRGSHCPIPPGRSLCEAMASASGGGTPLAGSKSSTCHPRSAPVSGAPSQSALPVSLQNPDLSTSDLACVFRGGFSFLLVSSCFSRARGMFSMGYKTLIRDFCGLVRDFCGLVRDFCGSIHRQTGRKRQLELRDVPGISEKK